MDAGINFKAELPSRHVTGGPARAASAHLSTIPRDVAKIFKRSRYSADSRLAGRYVAKDMYEVGNIPLLMNTLPGHGYLHAACMTVAGRSFAESLTSVKHTPDQDIVPAADRPIAVSGAVRHPGGASEQCYAGS